MNSILLKQWLTSIKDTAHEAIPDEGQRGLLTGQLIIDICLLCGADIDKLDLYDEDFNFIEKLNIELIKPQDREIIFNKLFSATFHLGEENIIWSEKFNKDMDELRKLRYKIKGFGRRNKSQKVHKAR